MNLSELTPLQLASLISAASAELASRLGVTSSAATPAPLPAPRSVNGRPSEPPLDDKEFVLRIKTVVSSGGYVTGEERARVAAIAQQYGQWVRLQGLPTERGTGPWRKLAQVSRIKPARER